MGGSANFHISKKRTPNDTSETSTSEVSGMILSIDAP
jgi:hypothetical protein